MSEGTADAAVLHATLVGGFIPSGTLCTTGGFVDGIRN